MATRDDRARQRVRQGRQSAAPLRVDTKYIRSNLCRVIHADGAWGGVTPRLNIHIAFFSERQVAPESSTYILDPKDHIAREEIKQGQKKEILREVEADVLMSVDGARSLRDWLTDRINVADQMAANPDAVFTTTSSASTEKSQ